MISHLKGREKALEPFGWTGRRAEWSALGLPPRRCLHPGAVDGLSGLPSREGTPRRPSPRRTWRGRRGEPARRHRRHRPHLPDPRASDLPSARRGGQAPTTDRGRRIEVVAVVRTPEEGSRAGDGARQLGARSPPLRNRRRDRPRDRPHRVGHPGGGCAGPPRVRKLAGRHEAQRRADEAGAQTGGPGTDALHRHMADVSARGGAIRMDSLPLMTVLECA